MKAFPEKLALLVFDLTTGYSVALRMLVRHLGWRGALETALACQRELILRNPFDNMNRLSSPNPGQSLSQRQIAPMIVLDRVLDKQGFDREKRFHIIREVTLGVALAYLEKSTPVLDRDRFFKSSPMKKQKFFERLIRKFHNAVGVLETTDAGFAFTVSRCYFCEYTEKLDVAYLMPILCESDVLFSKRRQSDVVFFRSRTLAQDKQPCDFRITVNSMT